jgi:hypothetical protein
MVKKVNSNGTRPKVASRVKKSHLWIQLQATKAEGEELSKKLRGSGLTKASFLRRVIEADRILIEGPGGTRFEILSSRTERKSISEL